MANLLRIVGVSGGTGEVALNKREVRRDRAFCPRGARHLGYVKSSIQF